PQPLAAQDVEPPTLTMMFTVNDSPFAGKEGKYVTTRNIRERLDKELESNVALKVEESTDKGAFKVSGRGLLHLGVLVENMRREGYELSIGKPHVILRRDDNGQMLEPIEYLVIDVPEKALGGVMELVGNRRGEMVKMDNRNGQVHLEFTIPARGLIGLRTRLLNATSGQAIMHHNFHEYAPVRGEVPARTNGVMIQNEGGYANNYALNMLQERGVMFVDHNDPVYEGQVVGEHCRDSDIVVNVTKLKKLSNVRTTASDENIILKPIRKATLEQALEYIEDDELVEVTPAAIRLRKSLLKEHDRKKANKKAVEVVEA
ncbi:MAG TPA: translational GTPase TypA, partial [Tepidisphaeraceae bacterium]|nr:translational GTPase TypA [Tepidisphaeraceae bacterium]